MKDNVKVGFASAFGMGSPVSNVLVENAEPILKLLLLAAQVGVAIITIFYIYRQAQNLRNKDKDKKP